MKMDEYIEKIKERTKYYNNIEKLRYIYFYIWKIISFYTNFIYLTNKKKSYIYDNIIYDKERLDQDFEKRIIICKSLAYIMKYILNKVGIKTEINIDYYENISYKHVNNIVTLDDEKYIIDLQQDLKNIQIHSTTEYFLIDKFEYQTISKNQLKKIDEKIGYISDDNPYIEEYLYIIKKSLNENLKIEEKIEKILYLLNNYINTNNMGYYEIRSSYYSLIKSLLNQRERNCIKFIDGYQMGIKNKYNLFILVNNTIVYMYSNNKFNKITLYDISLLVKGGYVLLGDIPKLKKILKK